MPPGSPTSSPVAGAENHGRPSIRAATSSTPSKRRSGRSRERATSAMPCSRGQSRRRRRYDRGHHRTIRGRTLRPERHSPRLGHSSRVAREASDSGEATPGVSVGGRRAHTVRLARCDAVPDLRFQEPNHGESVYLLQAGPASRRRRLQVSTSAQRHACRPVPRRALEEALFCTASFYRLPFNGLLVHAAPGGVGPLGRFHHDGHYVGVIQIVRTGAASARRGSSAIHRISDPLEVYGDT